MSGQATFDDVNGAPGRKGPEKPAGRFSLSGIFKKAGGYIRGNKTETGSILTSILLGTTALATPLLAAAAGMGIAGTAIAGLVMGGSCYLLTKTSDALVNHSAGLGRKAGISSLLIGLGLGVMTSFPELLVSVGSIFQGTPDLGIGNIVGSNIANTLLILGVTAAMAGINKAKGVAWKFNTLAATGVTAGFGVQLMTNSLNPLSAMAMAALAGLYLYGNYRTEKADRKEAAGKTASAEKDEDEEKIDRMPGWFNAAWATAGVAGLVYAADLLVNSATTFAGNIGISEAIIGTLAVAVGTSLPELAVSVKSARQGKTDMAIGNVLGSNVFNVLMVGGALAAAGVDVPSAFSPDTPLGMTNLIALGGSAALLGGTLLKQKGALKKWQGYAALALYAAYVGATVHFNEKAAPLPEPPPHHIEQVMPAEPPPDETPPSAVRLALPAPG